MILNSILDRLQPDWIINYHEHDSLLKHVFSEELSEEERKAAWDDYRAQIAQYDNATYYNALQNQLDSATSGGGPLQLALGQSGNSLPGSSGVKPEGGAANQQQQQRQLQGSLLLTVLSNTTRNVKNLIGLLQEKASLSAKQSEYMRYHHPIPPTITSQILKNNRQITGHYALVDEGVTKVNSTLQKCHTGEIYLEPGVNQLANQLRAQLIANLDILRSGSKNPSQSAAVPRQPHVGGGGNSSAAAQLAQQLVQRASLAQAEVHNKLGNYHVGGGGPSSGLS